MPWLWLLMACVLLKVEGEAGKKKKMVGKPRKYDHGILMIRHAKLSMALTN